MNPFKLGGKPFLDLQKAAFSQTITSLEKMKMKFGLLFNRAFSSQF